MDCVGIFLLKLADRHEAGLDDLVLDGVMVFQSLLELMGSERYGFSGGHCRLQWNHVGSFGEVKWQEGLDSVGHIICGMSEGFVSSDPFCLEDGISHSQPFSFLSVTYLYNCFPDI
jgi:hypothetical protein